MHVDLDAVGVPRADADEQVLHQPAVFRGSGFEFRHRAKIDQAGINDLTSGDPIQQLLRAESDADILDIDDGAVVHLEGIFRLDFGKAVRANGLKIRTVRKDRPFHAFAMQLAAENRNDPPDAVAEIAGDNRRADLDREAEDIFEEQVSLHPSHLRQQPPPQPSPFQGEGV
jgi:hypothetical protein